MIEVTIDKTGALVLKSGMLCNIIKVRKSDLLRALLGNLRKSYEEYSTWLTTKTFDKVGIQLFNNNYCSLLDSITYVRIEDDNLVSLIQDYGNVTGVTTIQLPKTTMIYAVELLLTT